MGGAGELESWFHWPAEVWGGADFGDGGGQAGGRWQNGGGSCSSGVSGSAAPLARGEIA